MPRITEMFAFVVAGAGPDDEGVPAFMAPDGRTMLPMMGADVARVQSLMPIAQEIADQTGKTMRIFKFTGKEQIGEVRPRGSGE